VIARPTAEPRGTLREAIKAVLLTRAALWLVALLAVAAFGHAPNTGPVPTNELANLPGRWDAGWYLGIASGGYRWDGPDHDPGRLAFFPAYPLALKAVGRALHLPDEEPPWLWAGVVVSTIFFTAGLFYVGRLAHLLFDPDAATRAIWLLAAYPFSIFYGQVYTESLFLAAGAGAWYLSMRRRYIGSMAWGFVAGLTRPTGCLISMLVGWPLFTRWRKGELGAHERVPALLAVSSPFLGLAAYAGYIKFISGSWFEWMTAQQRWGRQSTNALDVASSLVTAIRDAGPAGYLLAHPYEAVNALAAILALAAIWPVARRAGAGAGLFVAASVLVPLSFGGLISFGRFTSVMFPAFIWLASVARTPALPVGFAVLQGLFAAMFFTDRGIF